MSRIAPQHASPDWPARLLLAGLALTGFFAVYVWLLRLGDDLLWDEAYNFRVYARHPVIALALYWEPNNHVFETFLKSIPRGLLGLERPAFYRLTSFAILCLLLGVAGTMFRSLWLRRSWAAAALLAVLLLTGEAGFDQAMRLRGYFLSMALAFVFIALAARRADGWNGDSSPPANTEPENLPAASLGRRDLLTFSGLSALMLWTVPSNAVMLPALWLAACWRKGTGGVAALARRIAALAAASAAFTLLLYAPVLLGFALNVNRLENLPAGEPLGFPAVLLAEPLTLMRLAAPAFSASDTNLIGGCMLTAIGVLTLAALVFGRRHPAFAPGLILVYGTLTLSTLAALIVRYPERAKTPLTVPLVLGSVLLMQAAMTDRSRALRLIVAFAVLIAGLAALPPIAARTSLQRTESRTVGFLETYARPAENRVLICNKSQPLQLDLESSFPDDWIAQGALDLDLIFKGEEHGTELMKREWLQRLRDFLLPPVQRKAAQPVDIDLLIYIIDEKIGRDPTGWEHEALDSIRERLTHREEFRQDYYRIVVFRE